MSIEIAITEFSLGPGALEAGSTGREPPGFIEIYPWVITSYEDPELYACIVRITRENNETLKAIRPAAVELIRTLGENGEKSLKIEYRRAVA